MAGPASAVQRQAAVGAGRPRSPRADSDRRAPSHQHRVPFCSSPQSAAFQLHSYKVSGSDVQTMSVVVSLYSPTVAVAVVDKIKGREREIFFLGGLARFDVFRIVGTLQPFQL
jgi:hypothetical protein